MQPPARRSADPVFARRIVVEYVDGDDRSRFGGGMASSAEREKGVYILYGSPDPVVIWPGGKR